MNHFTRISQFTYLFTQNFFKLTLLLEMKTIQNFSLTQSGLNLLVKILVQMILQIGMYFIENKCCQYLTRFIRLNMMSKMNQEYSITLCFLSEQHYSILLFSLVLMLQFYLKVLTDIFLTVEIPVSRLHLFLHYCK
jgi:hypothetical protein